LTCSDSRMPPEYLFDQGLGDLFVIRVAANVTAPSILGSLEYAVDHLQVLLIVVLGHENCGAVKSAVEDDAPDGNLGFLLREVHIRKNLPMEKKAAYAAATKTNVRFHAAELGKRSALLRDFAHSGRIAIAAGIFSLKTADIEWLPDPTKKVPTLKK
jgi:carbonic anhydrase